MRVLLSPHPDGNEKEISAQLRDEFIHYARHARNVGAFEKMAAADDPAQSELAFAVLLSISADRNSPRQARNGARQVIEAAWKSSKVASFLRAIGDAHAAGYDEQIRPYVNDTRAEVAAAAAYALAQIAQNTPAPQDGARNHLIGKLPYEEVVREASAAIGDPRLGAQLFDRLACVKCHTTSKSEPLKGPFLGDIAARYNQKEIIESILRPNAQIAQGFVTTTVETKDGTEYEGFIVRESGDELEIRNLAGATVIPKKDIVKRGTRPTSIMPEGLADQLKPEELAGLLAYLQSLKPK
jgi:putative heme-binding domain-containing protein